MAVMFDDDIQWQILCNKRKRSYLYIAGWKSAAKIKLCAICNITKNMVFLLIGIDSRVEVAFSLCISLPECPALE
jgi:hypothetical protein